MRLGFSHSGLMCLTTTLTLQNGKHMFESNLLHVYVFLQSVIHTCMHEPQLTINYEKNTRTLSEDYVVGKGQFQRCCLAVRHFWVSKPLKRRRRKSVLAIRARGVTCNKAFTYNLARANRFDRSPEVKQN